MADYLGVGQAAKEIGQGVRAPDITLGFYRGFFNEEICPIVAGRRMIPRGYLDQMKSILRRHGKLRPAGIGEVANG